LTLLFEAFQIAEGHLATFDLKQAFCLQAGEIPGNKLADRANLGCQFLVGKRESDFHTLGGALAGLLSEAQEIGSKPVADGCE